MTDSSNHSHQAAIVRTSAGTALELRRQAHLIELGLGAENKQNEDGGFHVKDLLRIVFKYKWWLVGSVLVSTAFAVFNWYTSVPVYQAVVVVQVDRVARIVQFNRDYDPYQDDDYLQLQTTYELLRSRALAERVVDDLRLDAQRSKAGVVALQGEASSAQQREAMVGSIISSVSVEPIRNSRLVRVRVNHVNPAQAASIANALAQSFIALNMERRNQSSDYARVFLEDQIKSTKAKLEESERQLNAYARDNAILTLDEKTNVLNQTYTDYSAALSRAEQERVKAEAMFAAVKANPMAAPMVADNKYMNVYREQKAKLEAEYNQNLKTYKPEFPKMLQLKAQIDQVSAQISAEESLILNVYATQLAAARQHEQDLRKRLDGTKRTVQDSQDKGVNLSLLKRELDTNRQIYDNLLQRMKEVGVTSGVTTNNITVVDEARAPKFPIYPSLQRNLGIGLVAGLVLGLALVFLKEKMDDSIKRPDEVEQKLKLALLGVIPFEKDVDEEEPVGWRSVDDPRGIFAESYRSARTALQFSTAEGAPKRMLVTSSVPSEGKSTTAMCLAVNFAQLGQKVLLVDADMRNPSLHRTFGMSNEKGLSSYLAGAQHQDSIIKTTRVPNLAVIAAGPHPPSPVDLLVGPRFLELLDKAEALGFDRIVVDGPPTLGLADAIVLGNQIQNVLFTIKMSKTRTVTIHEALRRMRLSGLFPIGAILTSVRMGSNAYGYGYADGYGYGYGYGYGKSSSGIQGRQGKAGLEGTVA